MNELAKNLIEKTPEIFDLDDVVKKYPTNYNESMNTVITQEVIRYNRLTACMKKDLGEFVKAVAGKVVMSEDLETIGDSMLNNVVPLRRTGDFGVGHLSLKPLSSWINDFRERIDFLKKR